MLTTPNVTSADNRPGAESRVKGEAYAHMVLDDEGSPALPLEDEPLTLRERAQELLRSISRGLQQRPMAAMGIALGIGYVVGRLRAASAGRS
ncbi:MAG TPA: hypothetical protein VHE35_36610 [Kofleriaceae bacterium]|nr:hypothetical protein [Kofleriaceae bacterium]